MILFVVFTHLGLNRAYYQVLIVFQLHVIVDKVLHFASIEYELSFWKTRVATFPSLGAISRAKSVPRIVKDRPTLRICSCASFFLFLL